MSVRGPQFEKLWLNTFGTKRGVGVNIIFSSAPASTDSVSAVHSGPTKKWKIKEIKGSSFKHAPKEKVP
jgi:hypothetical protein